MFIEATFVMTDEGATAKNLGQNFENHGMVNHSIGEYVRGEIHTHTIEGYFAIFKRGIAVLTACIIRHNERIALGVNDSERAEKVLRGTIGKRMTYQGAYGAGA
jgi:hypothetical protein